MAKKLPNCTDNGFCVIEQPSNKTKIKKSVSKKSQGKIIYFGDPMCSWCWGISEDILKLKNKYAQLLDFELVMGGLRPGGGDPWNAEMKNFLRHHWEQVNTFSGQPFNFELLDWEEFNYDTEPACRAVRIIRDLAPEKEFDFYREIQHQFYVDNKDPKTSDFYRSICAKLSIPFKAFRPLFLSSVYCETVKEDFIKSRDYGVHGFPTIILETKDQQFLISSGFSTFHKMSDRLDHALKTTVKKKKRMKKNILFELLSF
jgi:putative protein-disulfide isomerase